MVAGCVLLIFFRTRTSTIDFITILLRRWNSWCWWWFYVL